MTDTPVATNAPHQRMAGEEYRCQDANYRHSAAWDCSHLRFIAICDSAIRRVAILPLVHCRMKRSSRVRLRQCVQHGKWIVLVRQRFCGSSSCETVSRSRQSRCSQSFWRHVESTGPASLPHANCDCIAEQNFPQSNQTQHPASQRTAKSAIHPSRWLPATLNANDQNQPVCGADLFSGSTAHANSAAFFC